MIRIESFVSDVENITIINVDCERTVLRKMYDIAELYFYTVEHYTNSKEKRAKFLLFIFSRRIT